MKQTSTFFLKMGILVFSILLLIAMMMLPQMEGRAVGLSLVDIYSDPLIMFTYLGSIPFYVGLYQAYFFLNMVDAKKASSQAAIRALRTLRISAVAQIGLIALALIIIRFFTNGDDPAGPTMLGILVSLVLMCVAWVTLRFEKHLQKSTRKK